MNGLEFATKVSRTLIGQTKEQINESLYPESTALITNDPLSKPWEILVDSLTNYRLDRDDWSDKPAYQYSLLDIGTVRTWLQYSVRRVTDVVIGSSALLYGDRLAQYMPHYELINILPQQAGIIAAGIISGFGLWKLISEGKNINQERANIEKSFDIINNKQITPPNFLAMFENADRAREVAAQSQGKFADIQVKVNEFTTNITFWISDMGEDPNTMLNDLGISPISQEVFDILAGLPGEYDSNDVNWAHAQILKKTQEIIAKLGMDPAEFRRQEKIIQDEAKKKRKG